MSGQPNRNPTDPAKFRQQYLANLALEANINDKNLQANMIYKKTGEVPSQMTDNRTTAEKLADIERLKIDVRGELSEITDGANANAIVQAIDPFQLEFLAQHIKEIVADIKPKYKYGIPVGIFENYLDAYMQRAVNTNEVNYGLQQAAGDNILLGIQQIMGNMINPQAIVFLSQQIAQAHQGGMINNALLVALQRDLVQMANIIPDQQFFQALQNNIDANVQYHIQQQVNNALQNVPTIQQVTDLQRQLQQAMTNNDRARAQQVADALHEILQLQPMVVQTMAQIKAELLGELDVRQGMTDDIKDEILQELRLAGIENKRTLNSVQRDLESSLQNFTRDQIAGAVENLIQKLNELRGNGEKLTAPIVKAVVKDAIAESLAEHARASPSPSPAANPFRMLTETSPDTTAAEYAKDVKQFRKPRDTPIYVPAGARDLSDDLRGEFTPSQAKKQERHTPITEHLINELDKHVTNYFTSHRTRKIYINKMASIFPQNINRELRIPVDSEDNNILDAAIRRINAKVTELTKGGGAKKGGRGLHRMHGRGLSNVTVGIMPTQKYVPFGRYFIDHHRINDDIISLRRGNGVNIFGLPVRRVTKDLGEVVRTILKNGHPSYNQIDKLTKEEKDYLYKVAKSSNLLDRLHIPSPTKEEDDQDINQFEILKGELLCGNDGNETIKKFKVLVMRMMNKGLLPKGQAKEILLDLATMGY
jgi:hypothetical protein